MLIAERHQKIIEILKVEKSIRVIELSKYFNLTEETIRRDLEKLETQGKLIRTHGGAINAPESPNVETPYFEREITNIIEKQQIAIEAVKHVSEGEKIILDASTTAWYMAKSLPDIKITIVTNSIKVATELSLKSNITVIMLGGVLRSESLSFIGPLTDSSLDSYYVDKAFISCKGIHLQRGLSESNEQQAQIKRKMMNNSNEVYIMLDHTKFGVQTFTQLGSLNIINHLITDYKTKDSMIKQFSQFKFNIIKTEKLNDRS